MNLESDLERGERARRLLTDPLLSQAFTDVRGAIIDRWENTPLRDKDGAHELKLMLRLLRDVQANLEQAVQNGKLAAAELNQLNRRELSPAEWRDSLSR